jgi:hypothetical protein
MRSEEAKQIVLALDGLAAHIETVRTLVISSIEKPSLITNNVCQHLNVRELKTHGGDSSLCEDCGVVGVLDKPENQE